jgi:polar amino acid transport system substrate-binding protein
MRRVAVAGLAWTLLLALPLQGGAAEPCELSVGWEPYAPYTYADDKGEVTGADIEMIETIAQEIGCSVELVELPWARILKEVENGTLDASTSTSWTQDRSAWAWFSEPYRETEIAIYVRRGEARRFELASLADVPEQRLRLGVIVDYFYGKELAELAGDPDYAAWLDGAPDYATNIRKLINGRIDGFLVEDVGVMHAELERLDALDLVERYPLRIPGQRLRFMFSRRTVDPAIVEQVDAAVARMRANGRLDAIMAKYLP